MLRFASTQFANRCNLRFDGFICTNTFPNKYGKVTNAIENIIGIIPTGLSGIGRIDVCSTFPFFAYTIGISLVDLRMKIDKKINTNTMISMKNNIPRKSPAPQAKFPYTFCVIPATIDEKINNDTPFDIPFSVISSPNRITNIDQVIIANALNRTVLIEIAITFPHRI
jgi:hypothetical protein